MAIEDNAEPVAVPTAGTAEHSKNMQICHTTRLTAGDLLRVL
jgi:hypothetical protein